VLVSIGEDAGHDAWIVGDQTYVGVDFSSETERYAKEG